MNTSRVVVTGLGLVTPIGCGVEAFWQAALRGKNGVRPLRSVDASGLRAATGGEVLDFHPAVHLAPEERGRLGRSSQFAVAASAMALEDAGIDLSRCDRSRIGISMGTTLGESQVIESVVKTLCSDGDVGSRLRELPPQCPCASIPASVARHFGVSGPHMMVPTACAAGNHAIGYAYDMIRLGRADAALAGGSDCFSAIALAGFNSLMAATRDVVRPFDRNRTGMAVGEGAGVLYLETLESAARRGASTYAEVRGYGLACDAFKMTIPDPGGSGGVAALTSALTHACVPPGSVDYVCAHGTGTRENDRIETIIVKKVFADRARTMRMSSIKSMLGHTMGAAAAIEAAACALMLKHQVVLPTINYEEPDPECDIDCIPNQPRPMHLETVVSNAYAFGGNTSALVLAACHG